MHHEKLFIKLIVISESIFCMVELVFLLQPNGRGSRDGTASSAYEAASADRGKFKGDASEEDQAETGDQADPAESEGRVGASETKLRQGAEPADEAEHREWHFGEDLETHSGQQESQPREEVSLLHVRSEAGDSHEISGALLQSGTGNYLSDPPESKRQAAGAEIRVD